MDRPSSLIHEPVSAVDYLAESREANDMARVAGLGLLTAIGVGLAVGLLVRALRPAPKPQERFVRLVEDLEDRLREIGEPALNKVGSMAMDGANSLGHRFHDGEVRLEKFLRSAARRLRGFGA